MRALDPAARAVVDVPGADAQAASTISENASEDDREMIMANDAKIVFAHASSRGATLPRRPLRAKPRHHLAHNVINANPYELAFLELELKR